MIPRAVLSRCFSLTALLTTAASMPAVGLRAQEAEASATLVGETLDSATWLPVSDAVIRIAGSNILDRTSASGEFQLTGVPIGSHRLMLLKIGYAPRLFGFTITRADKGHLDLGPVLLAVGQPAQMHVSGTVRNATTGLPVDAAAIGINGAMTLSGDSGTFSLEQTVVYLGASNLVEVRRIGYVPYVGDFPIDAASERLELDVALTPLPVELAEVVVLGDRTVYALGKRMREFYRRQRTGIGHHITRAQIEQRQARFVTDLLRTVPGLSVTPGASGRNNLRIIGSFSLYETCGGPNIYLDGVLMYGFDGVDLDFLVLPEELAGIEVYTRPAQIPAEYGGAESGCGVIAIWTR